MQYDLYFIIILSIISFFGVVLIGYPFIKLLKKNYYTQYIREEGPQSHRSKKGTPTMGGIIIVLPVTLLPLLLFVINDSLNMDVFIFYLIFLGNFIIGFVDDYLKVVKKNNDGIKPSQKLKAQVIVSIVAATLIFLTKETTVVSFFGYFDVTISYLYIPLALFILVGSANALNLTDGLDGLAAGTATITFFGLAILFYLQSNIHLLILSITLASSCAGFLVYNRKPAQLFMGDSGSLALGGALGGLALISRIDLWLAVIAGIYVIETLSVILQVLSFRWTGKRIFKMSPIHHHFELSGWSENKVVFTFCIVQTIFTAWGIYMLTI